MRIPAAADPAFGGQTPEAACFAAEQSGLLLRYV